MKQVGGKSEIYYSKINRNVLTMLEGRDNVVLDVGCGHGGLGATLLRSGSAKYVIGIEKNPEVAELAKKNINSVLCMDVENLILEQKDYFDYIILSHILEHLKNPLKVLEALKQSLKQEGRVIAGLPNIRYWRILQDLIFFDEWEYREAGILDSDHVRFFTHKSARRLFLEAGYLNIHSFLTINGIKQNMANNFTLNLFHGFLSSEIYIIANKIP